MVPANKQQKKWQQLSTDKSFVSSFCDWHCNRTLFATVQLKAFETSKKTVKKVNFVPKKVQRIQPYSVGESKD